MTSGNARARSGPAKAGAALPAGAEAPAAGGAHLLAELIDAWGVNNRIDLLLLDHVSDEGMAATLSTRGGRTVARQLAHLHMIRIARMENAKGKDLVAGLARFGSEDEPTRAQLKDAFTASGDAMARYLEDVATGRRVSAANKGGAGGLLAYLIAHEAHHRGSILLTLKQSGHKLDDALKWGIWAWDKI